MPDIQLITTELTSHDKRFQGPVKEVKSWNIRTSPVVVSDCPLSLYYESEVAEMIDQARSRNPIRSTLSSITCNPPSTLKPVINLGLGDPTHYPLHPPPTVATTVLRDVLESEMHNGYVPGVGTLEARRAVAEYHKRWDGVQYGVDDIVLVSQYS